MDICEYTKKLWKLYALRDDSEADRELLDAMDENISIIGTGKHGCRFCE